MLNRLSTNKRPAGMFPGVLTSARCDISSQGGKRATDGIGNCSKQLEFRHRHRTVVPQTFQAGAQKATFYQGTGTFECGE